MKNTNTSPYKITFLLMVITLLLSLVLQAKPGFAASYGKILLTGVGFDTSGDNIIVYASSYSGNLTDECAKTDWWWPAGTTHAFWLPKINKEHYSLLLTAYTAKNPLWVGAQPINLAYAAGIPCELDLGMQMGDF